MQRTIQSVNKSNRKLAIGFLIALGIIMAATIFFFGANRTISADYTSVKFNEIGQVGPEGNIRFIVLQTPDVPAQQLADRLHAEWIPKDYVTVCVFDNEAAAKLWLAYWNTQSNMSESEWEQQKAIINPHFIAQYIKDRATYTDELLVFSRDVAANTVQVINRIK